jgi:hypothetical protein
MGNPRNQKERVRYTFNFKRLDAVTRDTDNLNIELANFTASFRRRILPLDEIPNELLLSKPYRVTHSTPQASPGQNQANPSAPPSHHEPALDQEE